MAGQKEKLLGGKKAAVAEGSRKEKKGKPRPLGLWANGQRCGPPQLSQIKVAGAPRWAPQMGVTTSNEGSQQNWVGAGFTKLG